MGRRPKNARDDLDIIEEDLTQTCNILEHFQCAERVNHAHISILRISLRIAHFAAYSAAVLPLFNSNTSFFTCFYFVVYWTLADRYMQQVATVISGQTLHLVHDYSENSLNLILASQTRRKCLGLIVVATSTA